MFSPRPSNLREGDFYNIFLPSSHLTLLLDHQLPPDKTGPDKTTPRKFWILPTSLFTYFWLQNPLFIREKGYKNRYKFLAWFFTLFINHNARCSAPKNRRFAVRLICFLTHIHPQQWHDIFYTGVREFYHFILLTVVAWILDNVFTDWQTKCLTRHMCWYDIFFHVDKIASMADFIRSNDLFNYTVTVHRYM